MIAHIDVDAFFASALQRRRPELKGKPLLALGMGGGCVIAASYEAKAFGVKTGMRLSEAKTLCPKGIALPSDFDEALLASKQIEQMLKDHCPLVERYSVDEWFLDLKSLIGGLPDNLKYWIQDLQTEVLEATDLTVSVGIGSSKLLAKMASEYRKPAGLTILYRKDAPSVCLDSKQACITITAFLKDRPAAAIPGIGKQRSLHTTTHGWNTAWDIAMADTETVRKLFGKPGLMMQRELLGKCTEPVQTNRPPPKSISRTRSFHATQNRKMVYAHLLHHLTYTMLKLRREELCCRAICVWLRNGEYTFEKQEQKLPQPMDTEEQVLPYIHHCFEALYKSNRSYTQIGLGLYSLDLKGNTQYSLFEDTKKCDEAQNIQEALDTIHNTFGRELLKRGSALVVTGSKKKHLNMIE